ncbi:MAG TPA: 2-oxo-4-hydroxy-4-carboxy-5-ureidoimidazoline decarboxylase [Streptosporangiaceae bacterium]|nr:2-oxo-4-hydroxy-4-carboxy-5-ureidoimidazoline decarboxylase [Streptosporangiaceae bacterium]
MSSGITWLNELTAADAEWELRSCCAATVWVRRVAAARPFADAAALTEAADAAFAELQWPDIEEALHAHPRVGDRPRGLDRESSWSRGEQAGIIDAARDVAHDLHKENIAYEKRFGHVFLICATGLSAEQMLAALRDRLGNDEATERAIVRAELLKIVHLRLTKLLERP